MCVPNLVPIGLKMATCICLEGYTHRHTFSYIDSIIVHTFIMTLQLFNIFTHVLYALVFVQRFEHSNVIALIN